MILPDVNVLIYAFRADSVDHARYKAWLEETLNSPSSFGVSPQVLAGVVRVCTHKRIFVQPNTRDEVFKFCEIILEQPNAVLIEPGDRHWSLFEALCAKAAAVGNLVQDAWFAALAIESGCEWVTSDRDFAKFDTLRWRTAF